MNRVRFVHAIALLIACTAAPFLATPSLGDRYRDDGRYAPSVPRPETVLGHEVGDRPARHAEIVRYAEALAAASDRVVLERYAKTHEGRDLVVMIITSPENHARLAAIGHDIRAIADPRDPAGAARIAGTPAVAYLAHSIHGNELSGADGALRLAYELAAGETDDVRAILNDVVVLIDPLENPDGRERILTQNDGFRGAVPNPDPEALAKDGFWPGGRTNHYLFDLNRDWFALVHPESRGRANILRTWRPQLVVDAHEQGWESTFLFSPPRDPFNPNLPGSTIPQWLRFAEDQAKALDAHGWSYFTREWNEEFFPGYGSGLPLYQGAVGILYEQARTAGQPTRKPGGRVAEYWESVARQFTSGLANLRTLASHREDMLRTYRGARAEAIERGRSAPARAFYITPSPDAFRAQRLAWKLAAIGIEVERLDAPGRLAAAGSLYEGGRQSVTLPAGTFRVRLDQPDGLLARAVLEPHTPMPDSTLAREREYVERQKGSRIYDTTAWSPLIASGVECWWSASLDGLRWSALDPSAPGVNPVVSDAQALPGAGASELHAAIATLGAGIVEGDARYGWVFDGQSDRALAMASHLASRGVRVRTALEPFELGGVRHPRGSFLVRAEDQPEDARAAIAELAVTCGVRVVPIDTARNLVGPDFGGDMFVLVREPRIAILAGDPLSGYSIGTAWNLLDREFGFRVSLIDVASAATIDLDRYNVLVLPDVWGSPDAYRRALGDRGLAALRRWVEDGGTLVAIGDGARFLADSSSGLSEVRVRAQVAKDFPAPRFGLSVDAIRGLERLQGTGVGTDGKPMRYAGPMGVGGWPAELEIPGAGSPVLGPAAIAFSGVAGEAARRRGALKPIVTGEAKKDADGSDDTEKADERLRRFAPSGALLRADLDPEHWLCWGGGERVGVMVTPGDALIARDPAETASRYAAPDAMHLGGLLWPEAAGWIAQTAFVTRESMRHGQLVLFAADPNFRGYFWGTSRMFLNAVLLGPAMGTTEQVEW